MTPDATDPAAAGGPPDPAVASAAPSSSSTPPAGAPLPGGPTPQTGVAPRGGRGLFGRVYRSIIRHGFPDSNRARSLTVFTNIFLHIHPVKVRLRAMRFGQTLYLGGISAACFFILLVTGVLLMFYYHPSIPRAYQDMKDLDFVVSCGTFLRSLHRWSAHAMVAAVFLHMARVFYAGAYRPPREFNWVIGVILLLITVLLSYTGYLLPWDQLAYWGVTVGTKIGQSAPIVGEHSTFLLLGGNTLDENTLVRFYVIHCVVLPLALMFFLSIHIWRVRKDGGLYLPPREAPASGGDASATDASADEARADPAEPAAEAAREAAPPDSETREEA